METIFTPTTLDILIGVFGDVSSGNITLDGISTVLGMVPVSGVYSLTADLYAGDIIINSGATLYDNGFRIFGTSLINNGTVSAIGASATSNAGATAPATGTLAMGANGGAGSATNGSSGSNRTAATLGGAGGAGGNGFGGSGGSGGTVVVPTVANGGMPRSAIQIYNTHDVAQNNYRGGAGGGGGGGGSGGGISGGGGAGGGMLLLVCRTIINNGIISAAGGNGFNNTLESGGGGGGGGGAVLVITRAYSGANPIAPGGQGGAASGVSGLAGVNGSAGFTVVSLV